MENVLKNKNDKDTQIDVRTLLLYKLKPGCQHAYNKLLPKDNRVSPNLFITIGNYDAMTIYPTHDYSKIINDSAETKNDFLYMFYNEKQLLTEKYLETQLDTCNHTTFYHPVHLVKHCNDVDILNSFWEKETPYVVVTFVYGMLDSSLKELEETINNRLTQNSKNADVDFQIYRSINMSRLVVIWKGSKLKSILDMISNLSSFEQALNTHTICGFLYTTEKGGKIMEPPVQSDDIIDMVKITGTIRSHSKAKSQFNKIKNILGDPDNSILTDYLAYGNNDFNLIYKNIKTTDIIKLLNKWMEHPNIKEVHPLETAFFSIKTRVHTKYIKLKDDESYIDTKEIDDLFTKSLNILKDFKDPDKRQWPYHFIETINMLKDMSRNPALSRSIYFVKDSLNTFTDALDDIKSSCKDPKMLDSIMLQNKKSINKYTNAFSTLINQLVRVDGYLSQEPGFSPLIFNMIPAGLLGFYYSFIRHTIDTIKDLSAQNSSQKNCQYSVLLFPSLARYVKIDSVLFQNPVNKKPVYPPNQIYLVEIPYNMLYNPSDLLCIVTHEIMHFCGESIRCRSDRYNTYLGFLSEALVADFKIVCSNNATSDHVFENLLNMVDEKRDGLYLKALSKKARLAVASIYSNVTLKNQLHKLYLESNENLDPFSSYSTMNTINDATIKKKVVAQFAEIDYLFRECYADLITYRILKFDEQEYLKIIAKEIENIPKNENERTIQSTFEARIALVLYAIRKHSNTSINTDVSINNRNKCISDRISDLLKAIDNAYCNNNVKINPDYYFPIRSLLNVVDYLLKCSKVFDALYEADTSNELNTISIHYNLSKSSNDFFNDKYCELIDKMTTNK